MMQLFILFTTFLTVLFVSGKPLSKVHGNKVPSRLGPRDCDVTAPKVVIISLFSPEANVWYDNAHVTGSIGNLLEKNITVPGLSPLFPQVHCLGDGSVCQVTTGESEINAAATMTALVYSPLFDFRNTYFMVAGIAGVNPRHGTLGDVAFSKYAIQVALQYEIDIRELPDNFTTGYFPQGSQAPDQYPLDIYGTEVFEVNENLRDNAARFASKAVLTDSAAAKVYRARYGSSQAYVAATRSPQVISCDVTTSDVYFSGAKLGETFENTTKLLTNGSGVYCVTAQEDNAILEVMVRATLAKRVQFSRVIIMRTASDFDRPYPGQPTTQNLFMPPAGAFEAAVSNIFLAGTPVIQGILNQWLTRFERGVSPTNYIGDIFGSLGGQPDFGPVGRSLRPMP
ncbi:BgTH12-03825 [Blumeria graminis f. sp. triticale]|uniref:BgTH12-03825 n=1 Tax=Blumeria graminis f. sp. triticale TaxID=1689686 RepID=A0A9W4GBP9_BLUGR|nr:BgTH12-03825 [Blumeria graminis f. sp. triticale]